MKRRHLFSLLGASATALPFSGKAQQPSMPVIGFLNSASPGPYASNVAAFREGLKEFGYIEGQNVSIEFRWAEGRNDQLRALATDLVRRSVNVIAVPGSTPGALAAKAATETIPIVFAFGSDPVRIGLIASLGRPGGNVTGVTLLGAELAPKQLELLRMLAPSATALSLLINPTSPTLAGTQLQDLQAAARTLGVQLNVLSASTDRDIEAVFSALDKRRDKGILISSDAFFTSRVQKLADLSAGHGIPAIYWQREYAVAGGLISYGSSYSDAYRHAGRYTGRILRGEKPSEMAIEQATKVELVLNLKTAKKLGLAFPAYMLHRADVLIE